MKAILLAAGNGTRLRPLTDTLPKCLLPIGGVPLLQIWLDNCEAAGITQVLINSHSHREELANFVSKQRRSFQIRIAQEPELLGSAGTLTQNRDFVSQESAFFVLYADVLTNVNLRFLLASHLTSRMPATLGVYEVDNPSECGVVTIDDDGVIQRFTEKPRSPESRMAFAGLMVCGQEIFSFIPENRPADIGFHVLPRMTGRMKAVKISDYLIDVGTRASYERAQISWPGLTRTASSKD